MRSYEQYHPHRRKVVKAHLERLRRDQRAEELGQSLCWFLFLAPLIACAVIYFTVYLRSRPLTPRLRHYAGSSAVHRLFVVLVLGLLVGALLAPRPLSADSVSSPASRLQALETAQQQSDSNHSVSHGLRSKAQRDEALRAGACAGSAWETNQLNQRLDSRSLKLDRIFNFSLLEMRGNVMPPVIVEVRDPVHLESRDSMKTAWAAYKIKQDARIVTAPPNWRDYLEVKPSDCPPPANALLPNDDKEKDAWKAAVDEGWKDGVELANDIYATRVRELAADFVGMLKFQELSAQGMVDLPAIAGSQPHVVVQGRELTVGQREFRITRDSAFQPAAKWSPVIRNDFSAGEE